MKVVAIGCGIVGSKPVAMLRNRDHQVVVATPRTGVNTLTGVGLAAALEGADVVVNTINSRFDGDAALLEFFEASARNVIAAEAAAGVCRHITLSAVGSDRLQCNGRRCPTVVKEGLVANSSTPYSIVRATQLYEFVMTIADAATYDDVVRVAPVPVQPVAAEDACAVLTELTERPALNKTVEVAGPERFQLDDLIPKALRARGDRRRVHTEPHAKFFGSALTESTLLPTDEARTTSTRFDDWLRRGAVAA